MRPTLFDLDGKVAVITGSSRGIGKAIAHRMAEHGARVVVSSRKADACHTTTEAINAAFPGACVSIPCNISHKDQLRNLVDTTRAKLGPIDILVCNAAVNPYAGPMVDCPDDAFDRVMATNIRSNHWLAGMVLPEMKERGDGSIIIVSSTGGLIGAEFLGAYALSKAADMQLARNIAVEYGPFNVRANSISPGLIRTDFSRYLWENEEIRDKATAATPLRRMGEPDEIAGIAVLLASPAGRFINGHNVVADGGSTIGPTI